VDALAEAVAKLLPSVAPQDAVPQPHRPVVAAGGEHAPGAERHRVDGVGVALQGGAQRTPAVRVPQPHRLVVRGVLDVVRRELPGDVREFARWGLEVWREARRVGS
jgi:hypothetical protein